MLLVVAIVVVVAIAALVWMVRFRQHRQDPGIVGFRRHIDALSSESRREVQDRVREKSERDQENE